MKIAEAFVELRTDSRKARAEAVSDARSIAKETTKAFAQFFTAAVIVRELGKATEAAARLEQAVGGTEAIFGEFSSTVNDAAKTSAEAMGLSESAFREVTTRIGGLLNGLGFTQQEAAKTSVELAQLGADLAATFGGKPEEAVEALGAALRGEFDPLERFGVSLRVSQINLKAVEMGLASSKNEVSDHARAQAALALIMEASAEAQGQFGREAETAAGKSAILSAKFEDARAKLGEQLLPAFVMAVDLLEQLIDKFSGLPGPVQVALVALAGLVAIAGPIKNVIAAIGGLKAAIVALRTAMVAHPILAFAAVAVTVGFALKELTEKSNRATDAIDDMADAMKNAGNSAQGLRDYVDSIVSGNGDLIAAFDAADMSTQDFTDAIIAGGKDAEEAFNTLYNAILRTADGPDSMNAVVALYDLVAGAKAAQDEYLAWERVSEDTAAATDGVAGAADGATGAIEGMTDAAEELGPGLEELAEVQERLTDEILAGIEAMFDLEAATLSLEDSYANFQDQQLENLATQQDAEASDREKAESARALRQEEIKLAEEALGVAQAFAREKGAADGSRESAELQAAKLAELALQYPELRDEIQQYIDRLGKIPGAKTTEIQAALDSGNIFVIENTINRLARDRRSTIFIGYVNTGPNGQFAVPLAQGGVFDRATSAIIGEDGREVAIPLTKPSRIRELMSDPTVAGPIAAAMAGTGGGAGAPSGAGGSVQVVQHIANGDPNAMRRATGEAIDVAMFYAEWVK